MKDYLNCKKIDTAINRAKNMLIAQARNNGIYENFGQEEIRAIKDKFVDCCDYSEEMNINRNKLLAFECWCIGYAQ